MKISEALDLHNLAILDGEKHKAKRLLFNDLIQPQGRHFLGIIGPRGVGKTVLLKQLANEIDQTIYLSLDTLSPETDLFELIRRLADEYRFRTFLLDEVHYHPGIGGTLKKLYDFLDLQVYFTSSVALSLHDFSHDLSRRARLLTLLPFSWREYLSIRHGQSLEKLDIDQILDQTWDASYLQASSRFEAYLQGGLMPFALEEPDPLPLLDSILETIINKDIPKVARLHTDELDTLHKLMKFIGRSDVDGINYSSLARNLSITKYKAEQYINLLERAFVLQRTFPAGTNVLKEPKILMSLPYRLLYKDYTEAIGSIREDFCAQALTQAGISFSYLKSTRGRKVPDYMIT